MKKITLLLMMFTLVLVAFSQINADKGITVAQPIKVKSCRIKGQVISATTKKPIPTAIVMIAGSTNGTITDEKGKFAIDVPAIAKQLSFSAKEFQPVKAVIDTTKEMKIELTPKVQ